MGLKKHLTTFVSNWFGVIIAAVIVLVSGGFGGMYLYARSRIDNTINFVTQVIYLRYQDGLVKSGEIDEPPAYIYHLVLQVYNPFKDSVDVSVSDLSVLLDTYKFPVAEDGSWDKSLPTGYAIFEGYITIDAKTFAALADKGKVDVEIKGTIAGIGKYQWIKRQSERLFTISIPNVGFVLNPTPGTNASS
jgi:hypothetical protein